MNRIVSLLVAAAATAAAAHAQTFPPPIGATVLNAGFSFNVIRFEGSVYVEDDSTPATEIPADFSDMTQDGRPPLAPATGSASRGRVVLNGLGTFGDSWNTDFGTAEVFGLLTGSGNQTLNQTINTPLRQLGAPRFGTNLNSNLFTASDYVYSPNGLVFNSDVSAGRDRFAVEINSLGVRPTQVSVVHRQQDSGVASGSFNIFYAGSLLDPLVSIGSASIGVGASVLSINLSEAIQASLTDDSSWYLVFQMNATSSYLFDNLQVVGTAVPEPTTYALFGALAALAVVVARRRR